MKIEYYSPTIRRKEMDAVLTAMVEEKIGPGDRNRFLIQTAKDQIRFDFSLALRSPAVALHMALKALNARPDQLVIISPLSPRYYLQVLKDLQLTPLFCDVTYDFPCLNRDLIEKAINKKVNENIINCEEGSMLGPDGKVCAIVLHHTLGFIPDTASVAELGIPVIEDISQSYGYWLKPSAKNKEEKDASVPVYPVFNSVFVILGLEERDMLTSGGGALLFSMNKKDSALLKTISGIDDEYCLPDINAALAVVQFKELMRNIERRNEIAKVYFQAGMSLASRTKHKQFIFPADDKNNYYSYSLVLETGLKDVIAYAKKKEILLENAFEKTIAGQNIYDNCPVCNSLALRTVLFPMYPRLRSHEVERVSRLIMTLP